MNKTLLFIFLISTLTAGSQTVGLITQNPGSLDGYVLFAPIPSNNTYLIDKCGKLVHSWASTHHPGNSVYLLEDGTLLRPGSTGNAVFTSGGNGGIIEKFDWNSNLTWSYTISSSSECQHHDVRQLPNGNILAIVWESKTVAEAIAAGRNPAQLGASLWSEKIVELQPSGISSATIVWEWHVWDHLVQEHDPTKANYGTVSQHPELINLNYFTGMATNADWLHCNSVDYNEALDQIIISSHNFHEIWIVDHSTTTAEAASHSGGAHGAGGDLLYRWGNPAAYNRGIASDRKLFGQHNARWIESGFNNAGKIMIFNNGQGRPGGNHSSVDIINTPVDGSGNYSLATGQPYQPDSAEWMYTDPIPANFYSMNISGAQPLSNGNTLICAGPQGTFFEIDSTENIVWKYISPVSQSGIVSQGTTPVMNNVFRCTLYEPGYPGFTGHTLTPGNPVELNPLPYNCTMITGVDEIEKNNTQLHVNNPFSNSIILSVVEAMQDATINLYDVTGRIAASWQSPLLSKDQPVELRLNDGISDGVYLLHIKNSFVSFTTRLIRIR